MLSLVTACMNREQHLRRALPRWLALSGVDEVLIVDWSNPAPLDDLLALDPRVRLVRVEDEPCWVQTYPTNLAIARARGDLILKLDSDCLPSPAVAALRPAPGRFFAGDWREGRPLGKACVSGQCFFTRDQWLQVNGYSELFRRYSRDDVDFYERLAAAGHARHAIPVADLDFLPHDDEARVAHQAGPAGAADIERILHRQLDFHEAINLVVSAYQPWGPWYPQAPYEELSASPDGRLVRLRRDRSREIPLSAPLMRTARAHAIRAVAARLGKLAPAALDRLDEAACLRLIARQVHPPAALAG